MTFSRETKNNENIDFLRVTEGKVETEFPGQITTIFILLDKFWNDIFLPAATSNSRLNFNQGGTN